MVSTFTVEVLIYLSLISTISAKLCGHTIYEQISILENTDVSETPFRTLTGISTALDCSVACLWDALCLNLRIKDGVCSLFDSNLQPTGSVPGALYYSKYGDLCPTSNGYILKASPFMCYKLSTNTEDWSGAESQCQADGGQLIDLNEPVRHAFFIQVMIDEGLPWAWVGLKKTGSTFYWVDGNEDTSNWKSGGQNGDCGEISPDGTISFSCSSSVEYFCEILLPPYF